MLRWFKGRSRTAPEDAPQGTQSPGEAKPHAHGKFRLEPLEPRVLLSADPLAVAVIGQTLIDAASNPDSEAANAVVLQLDAGPSGDAAAAEGADLPGQATQENLSVAWPEGWQTSAVGSAQDTSAPALESEEQAPCRSRRFGSF